MAEISWCRCLVCWEGAGSGRAMIVSPSCLLSLLLLNEYFWAPCARATPRLCRDNGDSYVCIFASSGSSIPEAFASLCC